MKARPVASFNAIHVSASLHRLSRLLPGNGGGAGRAGSAITQAAPGTELRRMLDELVDRAAVLCSTMRSAELSGTVGALARLGVYPPPLVAELVHHSRDRLPDFSDKELLHMAWGLGRLGYVPDADWRRLFQAETSQRMGRLREQEVSNALWVFAKWGSAPSEAWLAAYTSRLASCLTGMRPQGLASVAWGAAMLQLRLPPALLDALLLECQVKFSSFNPYGLATLAWSLCRLNCRPRQLWLQDFVRAAGPQLQRFPVDQCFTNLVWALSNWEHAPPAQWLDDLCRAAVPFLPRMSASDLTILAVGLAELRARPPLPWAGFLLEELHRKHSGAQPADVAAFVWALSRMVAAPPGGASGGGGGRQAAGVAAAAAAIAGGGLSAPPQWLRDHGRVLQDLAARVAAGFGAPPTAAPPADSDSTAASGPGSGKGGSAQRGRAGGGGSWQPLGVVSLVDVVVGFADLAYFPGAAWMDAHEAALNGALLQLSSHQLGLVRRAYAAMEVLAEAAMAPPGGRPGLQPERGPGDFG